MLATIDEFPDLIAGNPLDMPSLRKMFLMMFQTHYSDVSHFGVLAPLMTNYMYSEDPKERKLEVELDDIFDERNPSRIPGIFVGTGDLKFSKLTLGDFTDSAEDNSSNTYIRRASITLEVSHVTARGDESALLGAASLDLLGGIRQMMIKGNPRIKSFDVEHQTKPAILEKSPQRLFSSKVVANIEWDWMWNTYMESLRLKNFSLDLSSSSS